MLKRKLKTIISGGGTGGHIFPAIAIANELKKANPENEILFVGAMGRMEMEKVPAAGYKIVGLNISGIKRKWSWSNFLIPFKVLSSVMKARSIVSAFQPDVVVGVGGYASGPLLFAATQLRIPSLIQEQNSYAGVTNKLLAKRVQRICVAYEGMENYFPKEKIVITGNPVRQDIHPSGNLREEAIRHFGLKPELKTVLVIGGSLGARTINESVAVAWPEWKKRNIQLIWQTGKSYFEKAQQSTGDVSGQGIVIRDFIHRMDLAYAAADVVVSRAGASSISELSLVAKPSILIPSPNVAEDHQTRNAMALVNKDAALLLKDHEAKAKLTETVTGLIENESRRKELSVNVSKLAEKDSAKRIVDELYMLAEKSNIKK